jgi:hypothetical protein
MSIHVINQNMASIRTRVTLDTSPLSIFVTFGEFRLHHLGRRSKF